MHCVRSITRDLYWIGGNDRRLALFESAYPVPRGVSYNAYVLLDEKTVLFDTVDRSITDQFFENLDHVLDGRALDYVVVHHMEPDHAATLRDLLARRPDVTVVGNQKTLAMFAQFFGQAPVNTLVVKEGETLSLGRHTLTFCMAPMVHWPEVMVSYDSTDKVLFSADAFGSFGALDGALFADQVDFDRDWLDEARRYYVNIVGKYGPQVTTALKKLESLPNEDGTVPDLNVKYLYDQAASFLLVKRGEPEGCILLEKQDADYILSYFCILSKAAPAEMMGLFRASYQVLKKYCDPEDKIYINALTETTQKMVLQMTDQKAKTVGQAAARYYIY